MTRPMDRIVVIGSSGSGKTTVARRLAAALHFPFLEMDSVFHRGGWAQTPPAEFRETLADFTAAQHWVVDGNYTSHGVREVVWPQGRHGGLARPTQTCGHDQSDSQDAEEADHP